MTSIVFRAINCPPKSKTGAARGADGQSSGKVNLAELAASTGYADQSHLTREFRAFAGVTPTQYRPRNRASIFHHRSRTPGQGLTGAR